MLNFLVASSTDGVVIDSKYFDYRSAAFPYNLGRTMTHEVTG
jgi:hypothetical protein